MKNVGWILVLLLGIIWAYLDLYGTESIPLVNKIKNTNIPEDLKNVENVTRQEGYVPGKSPDAQKAKEHIAKTLSHLPEEGPIEIVSQKILVTPREDGTWTEEWLIRKGNAEIPIQIDFGVGAANPK
jgi:hypothetical protein